VRSPSIILVLLTIVPMLAPAAASGDVPCPPDPVPAMAGHVYVQAGNSVGGVFAYGGRNAVLFVPTVGPGPTRVQITFAGTPDVLAPGDPLPPYSGSVSYAFYKQKAVESNTNALVCEDAAYGAGTYTGYSGGASSFLANEPGIYVLGFSLGASSIRSYGDAASAIAWSVQLFPCDGCV